MCRRRSSKQGCLAKAGHRFLASSPAASWQESCRAPLAVLVQAGAAVDQVAVPRAARQLPRVAGRALLQLRPQTAAAAAAAAAATAGVDVGGAMHLAVALVSSTTHCPWVQQDYQPTVVALHQEGGSRAGAAGYNNKAPRRRRSTFSSSSRRSSAAAGGPSLQSTCRRLSSRGGSSLGCCSGRCSAAMLRSARRAFARWQACPRMCLSRCVLEDAFL